MIPTQTLFPHFEVLLDLNNPSQMELDSAYKWQTRMPSVLKVNVVDRIDPIAVSMNRCIDRSSSNFLAIWNVDDLRSPDSLRSQYECISESSEISAVYGPYTVVKDFGGSKGRTVDLKTSPAIDFTTGMYLGPFMMFSKSAVEKVGSFDEQLKSGADFDLAVRLAMVGGIRDCGEHLGYYLAAGKGASTRPGSLQLVERTVIQVRYGITKGLDLTQVPLMYKYSISHIQQGGDLVQVCDLVPGYNTYLAKRIEDYEARIWTKLLRIVNKYKERILIVVNRFHHR